MDADDDDVSAELVAKVKSMTKKKPPTESEATKATKGKGKVSAKGKEKAKSSEDEDNDEDNEVVEVQLTRLNVGFVGLNVFVDNGIGSHSSRSRRSTTTPFFSRRLPRRWLCQFTVSCLATRCRGARRSVRSSARSTSFPNSISTISG